MNQPQLKTFRLYQGETKITSYQAENKEKAELYFLGYVAERFNKKGLYGFQVKEKK